MKGIPVIDLFAGPGGLAEGFSKCMNSRGASPLFEIVMSIEKDAFAHRTLLLRSFCRQFPGGPPSAYYDYLRGAVSRDFLFDKFKVKARMAESEAHRHELGVSESEDAKIDESIQSRLRQWKDTPWVLIGGPPCQAYSLAGRSRVIGASGRHHYERDPRHYLYKHYLRIIAKHRPAVFVMENVKGLLSATIGGVNTFERIRQDLCEVRDNAGSVVAQYELIPLDAPTNADDESPGRFVLKSENFGIPQARHRIIIIGVCKELSSNIASRPTLKPEQKISVKSTIENLPGLRSDVSDRKDHGRNWHDALKSIRTSRWFKRLHDSRLKARIERAIQESQKWQSSGAQYCASSGRLDSQSNDKYYVRKLRGYCNHSSRSHMESDLHRYVFAASFAEINEKSPVLDEFPDELLPNHKNALCGPKKSIFADRFRVQLAGSPATTIVSHIAKDGHYFIHYDPSQARSLTVREAARLQTFPDDYFFEGPRTEQYRQVGNAVPPKLAEKIAQCVASLIR